MKRDLNYKDIIWKRIHKDTFLDKMLLSKDELAARLVKTEAELRKAVYELIVSTWSESYDEEYVKQGHERTINFLKDEGYIKDTED